MDVGGLVVIAEDDESRLKSFFFLLTGCAVPSIPLLRLFGGYLKEESEGH